jgi:hypothetical protein
VKALGERNAPHEARIERVSPIEAGTSAINTYVRIGIYGAVVVGIVDRLAVG